jgi:hypothetical protein
MARRSPRSASTPRRLSISMSSDGMEGTRRASRGRFMVDMTGRMTENAKGWFCSSGNALLRLRGITLES